MAAIGLFRGSMHIMEWGNEDMMAMIPRPCIGIPIREAFPEAEFEVAQAAMDECFRSGEFMKLVRPHGVLWLGPRYDGRGRVVGVATHLEFVPLTADAPPPTILRVPHLEAVRG